MEMKKLVKGLTVVGLLAFTGNSFAATADGTLGTTSTGTVDIDVNIGSMVQISGLVPMTGNFYNSGDGDVTDSTPACIFRNGNANYEITATSSNGVGTEFFLSDTVNPDIEYTVALDEGSGPVALTNATTNSTFTNANTTQADCSSGIAAATLSITVPESGTLGTAPDSTYLDELTILVAPR